MAQEEAGSTERNGGEGKAVNFEAFKPQLVLPESKAEEAVMFYKAAFGAEELKKMYHPKRKAEQDLPLILFVELKIGSSSFLVCDQTDDLIPAIDGSGCGVVFRLETENVDVAVAKAVEAGALADGEIVEVEGGGGLLRKVKDPFGVIWVIASPGKKTCEPAV